MANQKANAQLQQLEEQALPLFQQGNILGALDMLERVMGIEKRWYHLYAKACWLYELPEKDIPKLWEVVQEGFSRFPDHRFWFLYIRADLRHRAVGLFATQQKLEDSVFQLTEALKDVDSAAYELRKRPQIVEAILDNPPCMFPETWCGIDIKGAIAKIETLRLNIVSYNQLISTMKYVFDAENRINNRIDKQEQQMHSEKIRIIEILGFFTAIMAFIILTGNAVINATYKEAMPILGGLSFVIILFVTVASLVNSTFYRYRDILKDLRFWLAVLLVFILSFLIWDSRKERQNPDALSTNNPQTRYDKSE